jgi:hypothetical protein
MKLPAICAAIAMALYVSALIAPFDPAGRRPGIGLSGPVAGDQQIHWQGRKQIFLETRPWYLIPHSVTTVAWVRDGSIFVPCGSCSGKRWPRNVAARPDVRLKIDGAIYPRRAIRISDPEERRWALNTPVTEEPPADLAVFRMERISTR